MATPRERLELLRKRKRLEELRALKTQSGQPTQAQAVQPQPEQAETSFLDQAIGSIDSAAALASGIIAEPLAGIAGIGQALNPFEDEGAGARAVKSVKEALTFKPRTEAGKSQQGSIGEKLAPVGKALSDTEKFLGNSTLELTGSPALAAVAHSLPTAALELLGIKGKSLTKSVKPSSKQVKKALVESAPEVNQLKDASRKVYDEIDASGVRIKKQSFDTLINKIEQVTKKKGLDPRTTPLASGGLDTLKKSKGVDQTLGELDKLREVASNVAADLNPRQKALGNIMIAEIDDFLGNMKASDTLRGTDTAANTGKKFNAARKLWGRARRSELITQALKEAENSASGIENGIRKELNKITRSKKLSKFFPKNELSAMNDVIKGDVKQNMAKLVGRFGLSNSRSNNILSALGGIGGGGVVGGGIGAFVVPAIGTVSKQIAKKLTTNKANFVDTIVRAGSDGDKIARAYLTSVPKANRKVSDLADLLTDPNVNISVLEDIANKTVQDALEIAKGKRAINLASGAVAGSVSQQEANKQ
jgi:hypothetical protein